MKHRNPVPMDRLSPYESFGEGIRVLDFLPQASGVLNSPAGAGAALKIPSCLHAACARSGARTLAL
jgi:hypothetical protein